MTTGLFTWTVSTGTWHWSPETFRLFGYEPDTIDPTTELIIGHACADAGSLIDDIIAGCRTRATRFSSYRPVVTAGGRTAMVLATGTITRDQRHHLIADGQLVDLTTHHRRAGDDAVRAATHTRDQISQAVGVIMVSHHLDATDAFDLLVWHSQSHNTKLATLAARLIDQLPQLPTDTTQRVLVGRLLHDASTRTSQ